MRKRFIGCLMLAIATIAVDRVAAAAELVPVTLDAKAIASGQVRTAPLKRLDRAPPITAYGIVLDPGPLATLSAQFAAAHSKIVAGEARSALARSEAMRAADLYRVQHNVSQAALQTAQSHLQVAEADQATVKAQLAELQAHIRADWGPTLAAAVVSATTPQPQLESGTELLVQVSLPLGQALPLPSPEASATTPDGVHVALRLLSRAPRAAEGVAGQSLFYLMAAQELGADRHATHGRVERRCPESGALRAPLGGGVAQWTGARLSPDRPGLVCARPRPHLIRHRRRLFRAAGSECHIASRRPDRRRGCRVAVFRVGVACASCESSQVRR